MDQLPSDRPLDDESDDALERGPFVTMLTEVISRSPRDGYTIALNAPWGDGKTTVLNFVIRRTLQRGDARAVTFDPWWFSKEEDLVLRFFSEMASQLTKKSGVPPAVAQALVQFGHVLQLADDIGIPFVALGSRASRRAARQVVEGRRSVHEEKQRLAGQLQSLDVPLLIVIDDIDRLEAAEIREVMRLIRAVGDLPNVTYLLGFDTTPVTAALGYDESRRGSLALEKIVQASFSLPAPRRARLDAELTTVLNAAITAVPNVRFDRERWSLIEYAGVHRLARNMRHIKRLAGALPSTVARLEDEVELSDVIALELIRVSEPRVFQALLGNQDLFTSPPRQTTILPTRNLDAETERRAAALQNVAEVAHDQRTVMRVLGELFPAISDLLDEGYTHRGADATARRHGRVAHAEILDVYLHRGLTAGAPSRSFVAGAIEALSTAERIDELMTAEPDSLANLVERLQDHVDEIELADPLRTLERLLAAAHRLRGPDDDGPWTRTPASRVESLIWRLLLTLPPAEVGRLILSVKTPDLTTWATLLRMVDPENGKSQAPSDDVDRALNRLADRVLASTAESLAQEPDMAHLIWRTEQVDQERLDAAMKSWLEDDSFLLRWLERSVRIVGRDDVDWEYITRHVPETKLRQRLEHLSVVPDRPASVAALSAVRARLAEHD